MLRVSWYLTALLIVHAVSVLQGKVVVCFSTADDTEIVHLSSFYVPLQIIAQSVSSLGREFVIV